MADPVRYTGVTVRFADTTALDDVSFCVPRGRVVGLVGSNGAGKTTAIRVLLGHCRPQAGTATIFGQALRDREHPARDLGAVTESVGLEPRFSARTMLQVSARAAGIDEAEVDAALERTEADSFARKEIRTLSTGMRQRVALAQALLGNPRILVLDEPLTGLDPDGIRWLRRMVRDFAASGGSVLLSSHVLAEVEQTVDRVVLLKRRVLFDGLLSELPGGGLEDAYFSLMSSDAPTKEA